MFIQDFMLSNGNRFEITACKTSVSWKTFCYDEQVTTLKRQFFIAQCNKPSNVSESILLRTHGAAIRIGEHFQNNFFHCCIGKFCLSLFDEESILCKAACIKEERNAIFFTHRSCIPDILHTDRLPAA